MSNVIIGTAGHVDHGKTEIIRALTGHDTDRLREEKERGISIVLGFAPIDLGDGVTAGVVDVPGHERFVKNMVSGAVGVDCALLVIAADEGVMPQTEEHLEVLRLLGIDSGVIAITKIDLADEEVCEVVESEVGDLLADTALEKCPVVRVSAMTGAGVGELRDRLRDQVERVRPKGVDDFFRLPIDRIFTRSGIGTIVTGTTWSGMVRKGDELVLEPSGAKIRVREVQSFEHALESAESGTRTALALHGIKVNEVSIGDQVLEPGRLEVSSMLDASIEVGRLAGSAIKNRQRIRFHHAAGELLGRVILLDADRLGAGERGYVQLRLENPTVARGGDRFVLRTYSPMRVVAGGRIIDPNPPKAKRYQKRITQYLRALAEGNEDEAVFAFVAKHGRIGIRKNELLRLGFTAVRGAAILARLGGAGRIFGVGDRWISADTAKKAEEQIVRIIEEFTGQNPLLWGIDREELKERSRMSDSPLFDHILTSGERAGLFFFKGGRIRVGGGERALSDEDKSILADLRARIETAGFQFLSKQELAAVVVDEKRLSSYLHILQEEGEISRIGTDGFMGGKYHGRILEWIGRRFEEGKGVTVGDFKDAFEFSRKYAVPLLEHLDREGYTKRDGDTRVAGPALK